MELGALILIKRTGEVVALNPAARNLFTDDERTEAVELATRGLDSSPQGRMMRWAPAGGKPARLVWLTPMNDGAQEPSCYALAICDMENSPEVVPELLAKMFRLTKAELRLAIQMTAGRTPAEAAREMEVTIHTVRTYLKRLYLKVGVKSQAALVRRLLQTTSMNSTAS